MNGKTTPKPQTAKRPPTLTTSIFKTRQSARDVNDESAEVKQIRSKTQSLPKTDSKSFRAKVSIKNKSPIAKQSTMKRAKLVSKQGKHSTKPSTAIAKKAKKIRKTADLKSKKGSHVKNFHNLDQNAVPNGHESEVKDTKAKLAPQYKQGPSYKKKASLSPFIPICEFFLAEANCSTFNKLVKFYEKDLKEPLFALMLKKFFIKFNASEKYKENLELRKFFYRLRFCKGVTSILKNSAPKQPAEPEAQVQTK
jgi:hypothetical protein